MPKLGKRDTSVKPEGDQLLGAPEIVDKVEGDGQKDELDSNKRDPDSFGFKRAEDGTLQLNPHSKAGLFGGQQRYGWGMRELVNASHTTCQLPAMVKQKVMVNGMEQVEWQETGEKIYVLPLQVVEYFEHAMNSEQSPFVPKLAADDSEYTLTEMQAIEHLKKYRPLVFEDAAEAYRKYTNEMRPKVLNYIASRGAEVRAAEKKAQNM